MSACLAWWGVREIVTNPESIATIKDLGHSADLNLTFRTKPPLSVRRQFVAGWVEAMKPVHTSAITDAAETALREAITHADRPRDRLEALVRELSAAFQAAAHAATNGDAAKIAELAEGFRVACERIWIDFGGDPVHMPEIDIALDQGAAGERWTPRLFQQ